MRQSKRCFEKYAVEVLSLEGTYLRTDAQRVVIRDGDEKCSVEEYACRYFRRRGYSAVRVENDPIFALFGVLMWPVIQDPSDSRRRSVGVFDRRAADAGMKIVWTHRPSDFGKPEYGVRRAKVIEKHLSAIICEPQGLRQLFDLWLGPSDELGLYLGGRQTEHIQVARQLIEILPSASIVEMLRYLVEDYWGRRSGWPDLIVFRYNEFFFAEVKSATDKLGTSQQRWLLDNRKRLHFPFKLIEVRKLESEAVVGAC
jgi:VRR-NUC domain